MLAVIVVSVGLLLSVSFIRADTSNGTVVTLEEGVSPLVVDGVALVAVREGEQAWAFLGGDRRRELLEWCEVSQVFTTRQGGSSFNRDGEKLGGPSPAPELDQVRVSQTSTSEEYRIWPDDIIPSKPWPDGSVNGNPWEPRVGDDWVERFRQLPAFCPRPEDLPGSP